MANIFVQSDYFEEFRCTASECPETCCRGWIVEVEPKTYAAWEGLKDGASGRLLSDFVVSGSNRRQIAMNEGMTCPLLRADGLCPVVVEHGDELLPKICREYPRQWLEGAGFEHRTVAVRCAPVLDLLWARERFSYEWVGGEVALSEEPGARGEASATEEIMAACQGWKAKGLLDGCLERIQEARTEMASGESGELSAWVLAAIFGMLHGAHMRELALCENPETRDYGTEYINEENAQAALAEWKLPGIWNGGNDLLGELFVSARFDACLELAERIFASFLDNPVYGENFREKLAVGKRLVLGGASGEVSWEISEEIDRKLLLVIEEELFTSVFSPATEDYENAILQVQWLVLQYLVVRFLMACGENDIRRAVNRVFRITDLPDIQKILLFDENLLGWMWHPEQVGWMLGTGLSDHF